METSWAVSSLPDSRCGVLATSLRYAPNRMRESVASLVASVAIICRTVLVPPQWAANLGDWEGASPFSDCMDFAGLRDARGPWKPSP